MSKKKIFLSLFVLFFFSLTFTQIITTDTWWNLSDGRRFCDALNLFRISNGAPVYRSNGENQIPLVSSLHSGTPTLRHTDTLFPETDPYSYMTAGKPWVNGSWLSGILLYLVYLSGGGAVLTLLQVFIAAVIFLLLWNIRTRRISEITFLSLLLSLLIAYPRVQVRAELFGLLSTAALLQLLYRYRSGASTIKCFAGIVATMIFWTNTHPSFPLGLLIMGIFLTGELAEAFLIKMRVRSGNADSQDGSRLSFLAEVFIASFAATGVTPYGFAPWRVSQFFASNHGFVSKNLNEWIPLSIFWLKSIDPAVTFSIILVVTLGMGAILLNFRNLSVSWTLLWMTSSAMFFSSVRHASFFAMVSLPFLDMNWSGIVGRINEQGLRAKADRILKWGGFFAGVLMMLVAFDKITDYGVTRRANYEAFGSGFYTRTIPEQAVDFAKRNNLPGRVFNTYDLGGYLMFHWPERKVFIDTRMWFRGADDFQSYIELMREPEKVWDALEDKYQIRTVILKHLSREADALLPYLFKHPHWAVVFCDARGIVFLKRSEETAALIDVLAPRVDLKGLFERTEREYHPHWFWGRVRKSIGVLEYRRMGGGEKWGNAEMNDVFSPSSFSRVRPYSDTPILRYSGTQFLLPREIPFELYWVAHLYFRAGMYDEAESAFRRVLEFVPSLHDAYYFLGKIAAARKDFETAIGLFEKSLSLMPDFTPAQQELKLSRMLVGFRAVYP